MVDDGSTDGTARVARDHGAEVISFGENRGLPYGVAAGYAHAAEHGYAYCGRVDADGQHPVEELSRLLARVRAGECDVAVGSRFVSATATRPGGTSRARRGQSARRFCAAGCAWPSDARSPTRRAACTR